MDNYQKNELTRLVGKGVRFGNPMAPYTTFRVGGRAEAFYETNSLEELRRVIVYLNSEDIPYLVVGRGSNLLVKDEGIEGVVILLRGGLAELSAPGSPITADTCDAHESDLSILAGAGLPLADLLIYCRNSGFGGLEFLAGIPGTVGGAVVMNAGAFGKQIGDRVIEIHVVTPKGDVEMRNRSRLKFSYRLLQIEKGFVIVRASLRVDIEDGETVGGRIASYLKRRKERQPVEYPSAGSVFKNPPDDYAGRLIEQVGLKGKKIGGAMISEKHANYIVNTGGARAKDILALLSLAQEKVRKETGIQLEPEIQVAGS